MFRKTIVALFVGLSFSSFIRGQEASDVVAQSDDTMETHNAIRDMRDGILKAIKDKNVDDLLTYLHEEVVMTAQAGTELQVVRSHRGIREYMDRLLTGPDPGVKTLQVNIEVDELTILHGEDTGIAFGSTNDHYVLRDGSEFDLATRWSATLVKADEAWKVANLHLSSNLFDNPVLAGVKQMVYLVGGIAAVIGLLAGIAFARWFKSKPRHVDDLG